MEPNEWIFTFGVGSPHGQEFVRITGSWDDAREEMVRRFGTAWAFQYPSEEAAGVKRYRLTEIK